MNNIIPTSTLSHCLTTKYLFYRAMRRVFSYLKPNIATLQENDRQMANSLMHFIPTIRAVIRKLENTQSKIMRKNSQVSKY